MKFLVCNNIFDGPTNGSHFHRRCTQDQQEMEPDLPNYFIERLCRVILKQKEKAPKWTLVASSTTEPPHSVFNSSTTPASSASSTTPASSSSSRTPASSSSSSRTPASSASSTPGTAGPIKINTLTTKEESNFAISITSLTVLGVILLFGLIFGGFMFYICFKKTRNSYTTNEATFYQVTEL